MKHYTVFWNVFLIYVRQSFYHRTTAIVTVLMWSLRTGVTIILYAAIYKMMAQSSIKNITYDVAVSAMLLSAVYSGFATREVSYQINGENKSGMLEMWVNKPLSYVGLKMVEILGRCIPAVLGLSGVVMVFWSVTQNFPHVDALGWRLAAGVFLLIVGLAISLALHAMVGLTSIYIQDARPVNLVVDRIVSIFSGAFIPIGFFPHWFRLTGESLPTGATVYMTQIFYPDFFINLPRFLITQIIWLVLCWVGIVKMSRAANRKLTVNGG